LSNLTLNEVKAGNKIHDTFIISVANHKKDSNYGPAKLIVSQNLYSYLKIYCSYYRKQIALTNSPSNFFLSWNGDQMSSGQISKCSKSAWSKAGLGEQISCTLYRKSAVSAVHEKAPLMKSQLAVAMNHTEDTASKSYRIVEREKRALAGARQLAETMCSGNNTSKTRWDEMIKIRIFQLFSEELEKNDVHLDQVKIKSSQHNDLAYLDARKVYDKLRLKLSQSEYTTVLPCIPSESETVNDRVNRLFENDISNSSIVAPTSSLRTKDIFSPEDSNFWQKLVNISLHRDPYQYYASQMLWPHLLKGKHSLSSSQWIS
jgi:hypothetical protein